jgi:hypothetical protein
MVVKDAIILINVEQVVIEYCDEAIGKENDALKL